MGMDESNTGMAVIEAYTMRGVPVTPIKFTNLNKNVMINWFTYLVISKKIRMPRKFVELKSQILEQRRLVTSANVKYEHPQGQHDDQFWALCLCCYVARKELEGGEFDFYFSRL